MSFLNREINNKVFKKTIAPKAVLGLLISLCLTVIVSVTLIAIYVDSVNRTGIGDIPAAKNVGNWEYIDQNYVLKKYEILNYEGRKIGAVTLRDNKNGNKLVIFQTDFTLSEITKIKEETLNNLLSVYGLSNSYFKESGVTGKFGEEFDYNVVGWNSATSEKTGMIGNMECPLGNGNTSVIFLIVMNNLNSYSQSRALEFANNLNCPPATDGNNANNIENKLDTDKDGLIDKEEKMLHTDPFNVDTDSDGTNDGDEIKAGRNPTINKQWNDKYTPEEFDKVKRDIKFISIYNYDLLFPEK